MAKKTKAVGKAAKTPSVTQLRKEISSDTRREATLKHAAATAKSAGTRKHDEARAAELGKTVRSLKHELAGKPGSSKKRSWSPDEDVAFCSARAVAEALRIGLGPVLSDQDVLSLYWSTAKTKDDGQSVYGALMAAQGYGLRATDLFEHLQCVNGLERVVAEPAAPAAPAVFGLGDVSEFASLCQQSLFGGPRVTGLAAVDLSEHPESLVSAIRELWVPPPAADLGHALILGLDLPGSEPHAVTAGPDGTWWSWGEPYSPADFPGAVIEEAWAVTWS